MLTDEEEETLLKAEYNMPLNPEDRKHLLSAIKKLKEEEK